MHYEAPGFYKDAFNCPHCHAYASMKWNQLYILKQGGSIEEVEAHRAKCDRCGQVSLWKGMRIAAPISLVRHQADNTEQFNIESAAKSIQLYPSMSSAPMPSPDLPDDCRDDYMEARAIVANSPRGAAALLRLVVQKLCKHLGMPGHNINDDIKALVQERNLSEMVQQALDAIRVFGNNAVHPGELQLEDDTETAIVLFDMINIIVDEMISKPNKARALFDRLPSGAKAAIAKRDLPKH